MEITLLILGAVVLTIGAFNAGYQWCMIKNFDNEP